MTLVESPDIVRIHRCPPIFQSPSSFVRYRWRAQKTRHRQTRYCSLVRISTTAPLLLRGRCRGRRTLLERGEEAGGARDLDRIATQIVSAQDCHRQKQYDKHTYPSWCISEQRPPVKSFFSTTVTLKPAFASRAADAIPPAPAPMTTAVFCLAML